MRGPNWFEKKWIMFKWWYRRMYMPIFFPVFVMHIELHANNVPGDIWINPQGIRYIYMGKDMYAQMVTGDEDEL